MRFFLPPPPLGLSQFGSLMALGGGQRRHTYVHSLTFNCSRILIVCRLTLFCIHIGHWQGWGAATTQTTYCQTVYFLTLINFQTHNCLLLNFLLIGIVSRCFEIGLFKAVKIADQVGSKYLGQRSVIVHFRNGRTTALKWRTSCMHWMKIMDFTDQNVSIFFNKSTFWSIKSIIFIRCKCDVRHFKAVVLPFLKCTITFLQPKYLRSYQHLNDELFQDLSPIHKFSENNTLYSSCLKYSL